MAVGSKPTETGTGQLFMELEGLCNPSLHSLEEAVALASQMMRDNRLLDAKLVRWLLCASQSDLPPRRTAHVIRALDLLAAIAEPARIMPYLVQLLRSPDPNVRSKVVLVIGRGSGNVNWAENRIAESDPRVRANAVESLWNIPSDRSRALLWSMVEDANNRVAGNAVVGLYRLGECGSIPLLLNMSEHASAHFRATAAWAMGKVRDRRFVPALARMVRDPKHAVRRNVFRALLQIKNRARAIGDSGTLDVLINLVHRLPDGSRQLRVTVTSAAGEELAERLAATDFIICEGGRLICDYAFGGDSRPGKLAVGIALPCAPGTAAFRRWVQQGLFTCLDRKRPSDLWSVVRYADEDSNVDDSDWDAAGRARRSTDRVVLQRELSSAKPTGMSDPGAAGGLKVLIRDLGELPGIRHAILLAEAREHGGQDSNSSAAEVAGMAEASGVSVHVIVPEGSASDHWARDVSRLTRGSCFTVSTEAEATSACAKIYSRMLNSYEILYRPDELPDATETGEVAVEVFCDLGRGEGRFSPPARPSGEEPPAAGVLP